MASPPKAVAPELAWNHAVQDIPERGLSHRQQATPEELAGVAAALELLSCSRLVANYAITPSLEGRYRLHGTLEAIVCQACVVTLEPVDGRIEDVFDVTFWPAEQMPAAESGAIDLD